MVLIQYNQHFFVKIGMLDPFLELVLSFMLNDYCMYNTSVFMATFCLHSSWWYQTCNHLCCYIFSWGENPVCSVSSSSKAEGLEKSCSLLPQTEAVLFCDYSCSSLEEPAYTESALPAALHQSWLSSWVMLPFFTENIIFHASRVVR